MTETIDRNQLPYRPCVGIMLLNEKGQVFVANRKGADSAWQMPQGGIDKGELARDAALRELKEEIGTDKVFVMAMAREKLRYDLPDDLVGKVWGGKWRGQEQVWVAARFIGGESDINLETEEPEFDSWKWVDAGELPSLIVPFKRPVYEAVLAEFMPIIERLKRG